MMTTEDRFIALWTDYLEGDLDDDRMSELRQLIEDNSQLAALAAETFRMHRLLGMLSEDRNWHQDAFVQETMAMLPDSPAEFVQDVMMQLPCPAPKVRPRLVPYWGIWAAAALIAASCSIMWFSANIAPPVIATVTALDGDVQWTGDGGRVQRELRTGTKLYGGLLETLAHDAWIEITFNDGTEVTVAGHSLVVISEYEQQKTVYLREGNLSADVAKQPIGKPMRMLTRTADAEVLGTQFNLAAENDATRLVVNEGLVRVKRLADGSVQEVAADQHIIAALETENSFQAVNRQGYAEMWSARYPADSRYGEWIPPAKEAPGNLASKPLLWGDPKAKRTLLHVASSQVARENRPPLRLTTHTRIRVTGELDSSARVFLGLTALHPKGGFAGRYRYDLPVKVSGDSQSFDIDVPLADLAREEERFPNSAVGLDVFDCWLYTIHTDHGLRIHSVDFYQLP